MTQKEDYARILDFLPYGYPMGGKRMPIAQAIGISTLVLLELVPRRDVKLETKEKVYIGAEKRDKIYYIAGKLSAEKLTESAKIQLQEFIDEVVAEREKEFVDFFNNAQALNTRLHQIELLSGFGQKHTSEILKAREEKKFESFEDLKQRVSNIPDPRKAIQRRILDELSKKERFNLFVK